MPRRVVCLLTALAVLACAHAQESSGVDDFLSGLGSIEQVRDQDADARLRNEAAARVSGHIDPTAAAIDLQAIQITGLEATPRGIQVRRVALLSQVARDPWTPPPIAGAPRSDPQLMAWLSQAEALTDEAMGAVGPEHPEVISCQLLWCEILLRMGRPAAARPLALDCLNYWLDPAHDTLPGGVVLLGHSYRAVGLSLLEYPTAQFVEPATLDTAAPLARQIRTEPVYSQQARLGIDHLREAAQIYALQQDVPGLDQFGQRLRAECQAWRDVASSAVAADAGRAYAKWHAALRARVVSEASQRFSAVAGLRVALPRDGECYHYTSCSTLNGLHRTQDLSVAVTMRRPCSLCEPPTRADLNALRIIQFDGSPIVILDHRF